MIATIAGLALATVLSTRAAERPPEGSAAVTPEMLLEFGPLEDKEVLGRRAQEQYKSWHPEGDAVAGELDRPKLEMTLEAPEQYLLEGKVTVTAQVQPADAVSRVWLFVRREGRAVFAQIPMRHVGVGTYAVELGPDHTSGRWLKLYARADSLDGGKPGFFGGSDEPAMLVASPGTAWAAPYWLLSMPLVGLALWRLKVGRMKKARNAVPVLSARRREAASAQPPAPASSPAILPAHAAGASPHAAKQSVANAGAVRRSESEPGRIPLPQHVEPR